MTSPTLTGQSDIAHHLDALRESLGLSYPQLASLINVDRTHVWSVLTGRRRATPDIVSRLLIAMGKEARAA